jgi:hypothetical protein
LVLEQLFKAKQRLFLHKTINNGGKQPREGFEEKVLKRLYLQMEAMLATLLSSRPTKQRGNEVQKNHPW